MVLIRGTEREGQRMQILQDRRGRFRVSGDLKPGGDVAGLEGLEIFNLHESARRADTWYLRILAVYHQLILRPFFPFHLWHVDRGRIVFWDNVLAERPVTGVGGADAHQNIGLIVRTASGRKILRVQLDPYEESFRFVTTHVLLNRGTPVNEGSILEALRMGAAYVAFESIAPTEGFSFHAVEAGRELRMGSKVTQRASLVLKSPLEVRVRLFHNGSLQRELEGDRFEFTDLQPGYYRVELLPLHAPGLLFSKPWILSNPIYVTER